MRASLVVICAVTLLGCQRDATSGSAGLDAVAPDAAGADAAGGQAPSASPIRTGDRLRDQLGLQQRAANDREVQLDAMTGGDR